MNVESFLSLHPERYDFICGAVPECKNDDGCLLAWAGFFAGLPAGTGYLDVAKVFDLPSDMSQVIGAHFDWNSKPWRDPQKVVEWLKAYIEALTEDKVPAYWRHSDVN